MVINCNLANNAFVSTNIKVIDLENNNKQILDLMKQLNDEKKLIMIEEEKKRRDLENKCDSFLREFNSKIDSIRPDRDKLEKDNEDLRNGLKIEMDLVEKIKSDFEKLINERKASENLLSEEFKEQLKTRIEEYVNFFLYRVLLIRNSILSMLS